jgi:hypothetical protein
MKNICIAILLIVILLSSGCATQKITEIESIELREYSLAVEKVCLDMVDAAIYDLEELITNEPNVREPLRVYREHCLKELYDARWAITGTTRIGFAIRLRFINEN